MAIFEEPELFPNRRVERPPTNQSQPDGTLTRFRNRQIVFAEPAGAPANNDIHAIGMKGQLVKVRVRQVHLDEHLLVTLPPTIGDFRHVLGARLFRNGLERIDRRGRVVVQVIAADVCTNNVQMLELAADHPRQTNDGSGVR